MWFTSRLLVVTFIVQFVLSDLVTKIKATGKGVSIDNEIVSILLYADDIVLTAEK
jgi:hypothetical protein